MLMVILSLPEKWQFSLQSVRKGHQIVSCDALEDQRCQNPEHLGEHLHTMPYTGKKWGDTRSEAEKATIYKFEFIVFVSVTAAMVCRSGIA